MPSATPHGGPGQLWSSNAKALLELIASLQPVARPELTAQSGLSRTAVTQTVSELVSRGAVCEVGIDTARRGPAAQLYSINSELAFALAIDIGHHRFHVRLIDVLGNSVAERSGKCPPASATSQDLVDSLMDEVQTLPLDGLPVSLAVVGVPAVVSPSDQSLSLAESMPQSGENLAPLLETALGVPVRLDNDVNLAATAELHQGGGQESNNFLYLSVGFGLGAAIVMDGKVQPGWRGAAGELSYLPGTNWRADGVLGAASIATDAARAGLDPSLGPETIFAMARQGNQQARETVTATAHRLAVVAATVSLVVDPERIIIGGSIGANTDLLLPPLLENLRTDFPESTATIAASQVGRSAVLEGASHLAASTLRTHVFARVCARPPADPRNRERTHHDSAQ